MASHNYERVILVDGENTVQLIVDKAEAAKIRNDPSLAAQYMRPTTGTTEENTIISGDISNIVATTSTSGTGFIQIQANNHNVVHEETSRDEEKGGSDLSGDEKVTWNNLMVTLLLEEYKLRAHLFRDPKRRRKDLWIQIATEMRRNGYKTNSEMCDKKWRNLKQTYKSIKKNSHRTSRSTWDYYRHFDEIYGDDESFLTEIGILGGTSKQNEIKTISKVNYGSTTTQKTAASTALPRSNSLSSLSSLSDTSSYSRSNLKKKFKTESSRPPEWFRLFMRRYQEDEERKMDVLRRMHHETMKLEKRKCEAIEKLADLLNSQKKD